MIKISMINRFENWTLEKFKEYNKAYDEGAYKFSEAMKYDLDAIKKWISIRDTLTYTEDCSGNNWKYIKLYTGCGTKYGTKWIFVDLDRNLWRIQVTANEFYNGPQCEQLV